jgi:hypothetical protein
MMLYNKAEAFGIRGSEFLRINTQAVMRCLRQLPGRGTGLNMQRGGCLPETAMDRMADAGGSTIEKRRR